MKCLTVCPPHVLGFSETSLPNPTCFLWAGFWAPKRALLLHRNLIKSKQPFCLHSLILTCCKEESKAGRGEQRGEGGRASESQELWGQSPVQPFASGAELGGFGVTEKSGGYFYWWISGSSQSNDGLGSRSLSHHPNRAGKAEMGHAERCRAGRTWDGPEAEFVCVCVCVCVLGEYPKIECGSFSHLFVQLLPNEYLGSTSCFPGTVRGDKVWQVWWMDAGHGLQKQTYLLLIHAFPSGDHGKDPMQLPLASLQMIHLSRAAVGSEARESQGRMPFCIWRAGSRILTCSKEWRWRSSPILHRHLSSVVKWGVNRV